MSEWKEYRLGDIALSSDFVANGSFASLKENVKYLDSENYAILIRLYDFHNNWKGPFVYVDEGSFNFLKKSNVESGDLIIANVGANAGESFLAPPLKKSMTLGPNSILIKGSNCKYLFYYFNSTYGKWQLDSIITGSAQPKFNKTDLRNLKVKLPSETKQGLIVEILSSLDDKIELNNKINQELENLAQTLFKQWFIDFEFPNENGEPYKSSGGEMVDSELGEIPKGWGVVTIDDVTETVTKGTTPTTIGGSFTEKGINFIKVESLTESGAFIKSKFAHIDDETNQLLKRSIIKKGDVLFSIAGTIGRVAVVTNEILPANTNQAIAIIRPNKISSYFLKILMQSSLIQNDTQSNIVQAVQANLSLGVIKLTKFILPPNSILSKIDFQLNNIYDNINHLANENEQLISLRDTLLPKLISGELEINEIAR